MKPGAQDCPVSHDPRRPEHVRRAAGRSRDTARVFGGLVSLLVQAGPAGATMAEIGERYGLTRQRVYQILAQHEPGLSAARRRAAERGRRS